MASLHGGSTLMATIHDSRLTHVSTSGWFLVHIVSDFITYHCSLDMLVACDSSSRLGYAWGFRLQLMVTLRSVCLKVAQPPKAGWAHKIQSVMSIIRSMLHSEGFIVYFNFTQTSTNSHASACLSPIFLLAYESS